MMDKIGLFNLSSEVQTVLIVIFGLLTFFSTVFFVWKKIKPEANLKELIDRTNSWWKMVILFVFFVFINKTLAIIGIAFLSFIALREMLSTLNFRTADRKSMLWCYLVIPVQFYTVQIEYYRLFIVLIPVCMFMILPLRNLLVGETKGILVSNATMQWSLMITVFSISHIAYLLVLETPEGFTAGNEGYILYLLFLTQFNDVLQFLWGKAIGGKKIIPKISPNKTWAGFLGGLICTMILGYVFRFLTPFTIIQSLIAGFAIGFSGFVGDLNISAIKRDLEIKDMGDFIPGHGGIMDRLDSLSFTAMVFFHLTHLWTVK
jgi:phosphatidate cytidylyltransferase